MTHCNQPDHFPLDYIAGGCFATEAEIAAILGAGFDDLPSPTADAIAAGRAGVLCG
jgi:hypothetical protein